MNSTQEAGNASTSAYRLSLARLASALQATETSGAIERIVHDVPEHGTTDMSSKP